MKVLSSNDIVNIAKSVLNKNENLELFVGSGDDKKMVMKSGFKIRHIDSGLIYTVVSVLRPKDGGELKISCQRPGRELIIPASEFKQYERQ